MSRFLTALLLAFMATSAEAWSASVCSRQQMLQKIGSAASLVAVSTAGTPAAWAEKSGDLAYEKCLSGCMYECTKPKGVEQKSRLECLPDCKVQCKDLKPKKTQPQ